MTLEPVENLGRPLRADAERNRQRILAAAAEVFARRGLEAGLDEIARHAGVGTGTVYRRFPDKAMLIDALFESRLDALVDVARRAAEHPDPWTGLVDFVERSVEMQLADRGLKELLFGDGCAGINPRFAAKIESLRPLVTRVVQNAKASGDLRPDVAVTDLAVMQFMLHGVGSFGEAVEPDLWRRQLAILLAGLRANPAATPLPSVPLTIDQLEALCLPGERTIKLTH
jgi:AcrR family transcriptional regulator